MNVYISSFKVPNCYEFRESCRHQNFPFSDSIIHYMTMNPASTKFYSKIIQSCKYFFNKNPIIIIPYLVFHENKWKYSIQAKNKNVYLYNEYPLKRILTKIWITRDMRLKSPFCLTLDLVQKLFKCDATFIQICEQTLSFENFLLLSKNAKYLQFLNSTVHSNLNSLMQKVPFEALVNYLPDVTNIQCKFNSDDNQKDIFKKLMNLPHFSKIRFFGFIKVSEDFDIDLLFDCVKKNKNFTAMLWYRDSIPDELKRKLEEIADEFLRDASSNSYKPLFIYFSGLDFVKGQTMFNLTRNRQ